ASEHHELAASFVELSDRQRDLARAFASAETAGEPGAPPERIEEAPVEETPAIETSAVAQRVDPLLAGGDTDGGAR
ncbi:MAG: hypothetical protein IIA54_05785, partial [Chloroflexi bacterium]|nr:hypothetical protein [Chloroflexota bacterium]